jgi:uncharacterized protein DUF1656
VLFPDRSKPPPLERARLRARAQVSKIIARAGLYRHVWHAALFDVALYVCLLASLVFVSNEFVS